MHRFIRQVGDHLGMAQNGGEVTSDFGRLIQVPGLGVRGVLYGTVSDGSAAENPGKQTKIEEQAHQWKDGRLRCGDQVR